MFDNPWVRSKRVVFITVSFSTIVKGKSWREVLTTETGAGSSGTGIQPAWARSADNACIITVSLLKSDITSLTSQSQEASKVVVPRKASIFAKGVLTFVEDPPAL